MQPGGSDGMRQVFDLYIDRKTGMPHTDAPTEEARRTVKNVDCASWANRLAVMGLRLGGSELSRSSPGATVRVDGTNFKMTLDGVKQLFGDCAIYSQSAIMQCLVLVRFMSLFSFDFQAPLRSLCKVASQSAPNHPFLPSRRGS